MSLVTRAVQGDRGGKPRAHSASRAPAAMQGLSRLRRETVVEHPRPAGTPRAIVDKVNADVAEILRAPETQAFLKDQGSEALVMSPRQLHELLVSDVQKWAKVMKNWGGKD